MGQPGAPRAHKVSGQDVAQGSSAGVASQVARLDRNYERGGGYMTFKPQKAAGAGTWQATCPRCDGGHWDRITRQTRCRISLSFKTPEQGIIVEQLLKVWMASCRQYTTRRAHQMAKPRVEDLPSDPADIEAMKLPEG